MRTVIENRMLQNGESIVADGMTIPYSEGEISLEAKRIYIPRAGGFIFPEGGDIRVKFYENGGFRFVFLYLNHGADPNDQRYVYFILPAASAEETMSYRKEDVEILRNDENIQCVKERSSSLCGMIFRESGEIEGFKADQAMISMLKTDENGNITSLSVCDPTQIRESYSFSAKCNSPLISADNSAEISYKNNVLSATIKCDSARGRAYRFFK